MKFHFRNVSFQIFSRKHPPTPLEALSVDFWPQIVSVKLLPSWLLRPWIRPTQTAFHVVNLMCTFLLAWSVRCTQMGFQLLSVEHFPQIVSVKLLPSWLLRPWIRPTQTAFHVVARGRSYVHIVTCLICTLHTNGIPTTFNRTFSWNFQCTFFYLF